MEIQTEWNTEKVKRKEMECKFKELKLKLEEKQYDDGFDLDQQLSSNIPQLDGNPSNENLVLSTQEYIWECKCCQFARIFQSEAELEHHHNTTHTFIEYEECNFCYPWHEWT